MKQYYLHIDNKEEGPFSLNELANKSLTANMPVWYDGLPEWTTAGKIEELKPMFKAMPPPLVKPSAIAEMTTFDPIPEKKNHSKALWLTGLIVLVVLAILSFVEKAYKNSAASGSAYEDKVMTVEETERAIPLRFLEASGTYNSNFLGNKMKIHGTITNKATVAKYKDVVIEVTFYTKTKTVIQTERYVIYDYFPHGQSKPFELKVKDYNGTQSLGWEVVDAKSSI